MDLDELKATVRSVLLSSKHALTETELRKTFQEFYGLHLFNEFRKQGFENWDDPRFTDAFKGVLSYRNGLFRGISTENTKIIENLVAGTRQRKKG